MTISSVRGRSASEKQNNSVASVGKLKTRTERSTVSGSEPAAIAYCTVLQYSTLRYAYQNNVSGIRVESRERVTFAPTLMKHETAQQFHSHPFCSLTPRVELGSDVGSARGERPRSTSSCHKTTMSHAASLDGAVC